MLVQGGVELGSVNPLTTAESVEEFYAYDLNNDQSYGGSTDALPLADGRSVITIHQNIKTCEMSLVVVNGAPRETQNRLVTTFSGMYISGDLWRPLVSDDPEFTTVFPFDDEYDSIYLRKRGKTLMWWFYPKGSTDGMAQPLPDPNFRGCIEVQPEFNSPHPFFAFVYEKIKEWQFVTRGGSTVDLNMTQPLFICMGGSTSPNDAANAEPFPRVDNLGDCDDLEYPVCGYCERPVCHWHVFCNIYRFMNCVLGFDIPQP